jgi:hypothetical protein
MDSTENLGATPAPPIPQEIVRPPTETLRLLGHADKRLTDLAPIGALREGDLLVSLRRAAACNRQISTWLLRLRRRRLRHEVNRKKSKFER